MWKFNLQESDKEKIYNMYVNAYSKIGNVISFDNFFNYYNCSYLYNDKAVIMYWVHDYGNKIGTLFTDFSQEGKELLYNKLEELLKKPGWFVELSGALEHVMQNKRGLKNITDKSVLNKILPGLKYNEDGSYDREINGEIHTKKLFGNPCKLKLTNKNCGMLNPCSSFGISRDLNYLENLKV
jgi:hypothetical protein